LAPLPQLSEACGKYGAALLIDDAHGLGVIGDEGKGAVHDAGLNGAPNVVMTVTLSKSLGAQGGAILGPRRVIKHMVDHARSFISDTGLAPGRAAAAWTALRVLKEEPQLAAQARQNALELMERLTAAGLQVSTPTAAVVSVRAPSPEAAVAWANDCRTAG